jgi:hypothetical protein
MTSTASISIRSASHHPSITMTISKTDGASLATRRVARRARRLLLGGLVCESFVDLADLYGDKFESVRDAGLRGGIGIERRAGVRRLERFMCHGRQSSRKILPTDFLH